MMFVLTLAISRAVPLLLLFSALLVVGRFLYDRYRVWRPAVARALFAAVLLLGLLGAAPFVLRSGTLVAAELFLSLGRWERAESLFATSHRLGFSASGILGQDWAETRMNLERWRGAEEVLLLGVERRGEEWIATPNTIYLLGICRYYQGRFEAAAQTLGALEDSPFFFLKPYFLGRVAERRGDPEEALGLYRRALELKPDLVAALYQSVRLLVARGERERAAALVADFRAGPGGVADAPEVWRRLEAAAAGQPVPLPEIEFRVVQFHG